MTKSYRIASIPGDGIGPEVVSATIQVVEKLAKTLGTFNIDFTHIPWGTKYYKQHGRYVSEDALDHLRQFDAGLFGAVGDPGMCSLESHFKCKYLTIIRRSGSHLALGSSFSPPWSPSAVC